MQTFSRLALGALATLLLVVPTVVGADDAPPYPSATAAYREGVNALKAGKPATALPALEYAASRGVLGAQLKLARAYATGRDLPRDDTKAFIYFQQIADEQADVSPSSPIAKYAAEALVALGQYYLDGISAMPLPANATIAADLFRHAASYFGNAEAQYRLARLYMTGDGVEKNIGLAINWLATAAKKQHMAAQATLGEILWRGQEIGQRRARGLALIMLAHDNAVASGKEPDWIGALYQEALGGSDDAMRKSAETLLPQLGGAKVAAAAAAKPKSSEVMMLPASSSPKDAVAPSASAMPDATPLSKPGAPPPAPIGMSVGFGASTDAGGLKP
jgi:TPR repeat protein